MPPEAFLAEDPEAAARFAKATADLKSNRKFYPGGFDDKMSIAEAIDVLGLEGFNQYTLSKKHVKKVHRQIMIQNHPDRGGSPYLAMKINEARDILEEVAK